MNQISNQSVATLVEILHRQLLENGFAASAMERANRYAKYLSSFMEKNALQMYDESIGIDFLNSLQPHFSAVTNQNLRLFIARINAILKKESFVTHVKISELVVLPDSLEQLVIHYRKHCLEKGLRSSTIKNYESQCRAFLNSLADVGVCDCCSITTASISTVCLRQLNCSDFSSIRTFLKFLFEAKYLVKDFSSIIPRFRHPQPMPSVYSVPEVQQIEEKTNYDTPFGKRNYAMLLLATRLGIRAGDIVTMTFDELGLV